MKLSFVSYAATAVVAAPAFLARKVSGGCPMARFHGPNAVNPHDVNPEAVNVLKANQCSLEKHGTPLVHFKIPPKVRDGDAVVEAGVLKPTNGGDATRRRHNRKLQQDGDYADGSSKADPAYSNQNAGDGYEIPEGGYAAVRQAVIDKVLLNDQTFWPADFDPSQGPNYGGLFIRLAWHCNGSYRISDGRGGCDGAAIRFSPEAVWPDNASLNMALEILRPIKDMYGEKLSWGDLIVLAADAAMEYMGFTPIGFCGGRIDATNGDQSLPLGPSKLQQDLMPCMGYKDGLEMCPEGDICRPCDLPLGTEAVGLIYVEPEGTPVGDLVKTAPHIREVFARMGFDDRMTVAAIGGGHTFGKSHGPCKDPFEICDDTPPTLNEPEVPLRRLEEDKGGPTQFVSVHGCHQFCPNPETGSTEPPFVWQQKSTSGLEVTWTEEPTRWDNEYFTNIMRYNWTEYEGPGGHVQWKPEGENPPYIQMFTTDLALLYGEDEIYNEISTEYANSLGVFNRDFGMAWYQLMSRDMGPRTRCLGDELPPVQPWEEPMYLPMNTENKPDYVPIRSAIQASIDEKPSNVAAFASLAMQCAKTFRSSDYRGGCNGAAIRYSPSIDWPENESASSSLALLEPIKTEFPDITWSDLIVLAGQTAIESAGGLPMPFCGGRVDADNGDKSLGLEDRIYNDNDYTSILYDITNKGMSIAEGVALFATPNPLYPSFLYDSETATERQANPNDPYELTNQFFVRLKNTEEGSAMLTGEFADVVNEFINDNDYFLEQYAKAYNYMVTADLFNGPTKNACEGVDDPTLSANNEGAQEEDVQEEDAKEEDAKEEDTQEDPASDKNDVDMGNDKDSTANSTAATLFWSLFTTAVASTAVALMLVSY